MPKLKKENISSVLIVLMLIYLTFELKSLQFYKTSANLSKITCGRHVKESDIEYDSKVWQVFRLKNETYKIFNAYYDNRQSKTVVRVTILGKEPNITRDVVFCQFWLKDTPNEVPIVIQATQFVKMWHKKFFHEDHIKYPVMVTCPVYFGNLVPAAVSLTTEACGFATNKLKVINNQPADGVKKFVGICNKFMFFHDRKEIIRFIEWVELVRILGADKISMLLQYAHPEHLKIVNYYQNLGVIVSAEYQPPTGLPQGDGNYNLRQREILEVVVYNDCYYKFMYLYDFVAIFDIDEVIVPIRPEDYTWRDLVKRFNSSLDYDAFTPQHSVMMNLDIPPNPDFPEYHYILQHTEKTEPQNVWSKSFLRPETILVNYMHAPTFCFDGDRIDAGCHYQILDTKDSLLFHYRGSNFTDKTFKDTPSSQDTTMWKYKEDLMRGVAKVLSDTGFKP